MVLKNLTEERRTMGALLRKPYDVMVAEVYRRLAEEGFPDLRPAHSSVFRNVLPDGSRTTELAGRVGMTKQSMGYLVADLEAMGYVEQVADPVDGRARLIRLTVRGREAQEAAARFSAELEDEFAARVGRREWQAMRRTLERLFETL